MTTAEHSHHDHGRAASRRALTIALILTAGYMVVELVGGILANSLSLLADAGHMVTDAGSQAVVSECRCCSGQVVEPGRQGQPGHQPSAISWIHAWRCSGAK